MRSAIAESVLGRSPSSVTGKRPPPTDGPTTLKKGLVMTTAPHEIIQDSPPEALADVRDAMNRRGDFDPNPTDYADESDVFEVLAALEALTVEGEVLA